MARDRIEGILQAIWDPQEKARPAKNIPSDGWGIPSYDQNTHGKD